MAASQNQRVVHATVVVALLRARQGPSEPEQAISDQIDAACERIRTGTEELTDAEAEALRFLTTVRTVLTEGPPES